MTNEGVTILNCLCWLGLSLALVSSLGCSSRPALDQKPELSSSKTVILSITKELAQDEAVRAVVSVKELARGDKLVVRTHDGEIIGSIVTTGMRPGQNGGNYLLPVPATAISDKQVILRLEVRPNGAPEKSRAPSLLEVEQVELKVIPITPPP